MYSIILFSLITVTTLAQGADFRVISPQGSNPNVLEEDGHLAVKLLENCAYLQKKYPKEYATLHKPYLIVEMPVNRKFFDQDLCGLAVPDGDTIYVYPSAWTKNGCYSKRLIGTLVHEILHLMGLPDHSTVNINVDNDAIERTVYECWEKFTVEPTSVEKDYEENKIYQYNEIRK